MKLSELKNIRVRVAKIRDIGLFRKLWMQLLEKQSKEGSIVVANKKSLDFYENLFNLYVEKQFDGIVLFVADRGILMWGDNASPLDFGRKLVTNWGVYADSSEQKEDISTALLEYAEKWAKENNFTGILSEKYKGSKQISGFEPITTIVYKVFDN